MSASLQKQGQHRVVTYCKTSCQSPIRFSPLENFELHSENAAFWMELRCCCRSLMTTAGCTSRAENPRESKVSDLLGTSLPSYLRDIVSTTAGFRILMVKLYESVPVPPKGTGRFSSFSSSFRNWKHRSRTSSILNVCVPFSEIQ